ncbi:MAG: YARHG domain-containing protein [Lachnospiraceae bacterium]|nr:YARHG domain-containing protein [Lachnospiraceae bacterium]
MINSAKISETICVVLGISMLTGCGLADKLPGNDPAEEQAVQEEAVADTDTTEEEQGTPIMPVGNGGPGFKTGNDADDPDDETSDVYDYESIYAPILSETKEVLTSGYDYEKDYAYISTGMMERCMYPEDDILPEVIGYIYMDINGDDIPELLIGENDGYEYDDTQYVSYIYSGFTIIDDEPVLFLEGWARNRYHWMGDGYFFNTGSGGAMNTIFGQGHLPTGGDSIEWDDFYFSEEDMAIGGMAFFHNNTGSCDPGESERLNMSEHKFLRILNSYKCEPLSWTFFEGTSSPALTGTSLSDRELKAIEKKLNGIGYYGFLRSTYSDPTYIDWFEVFYVGAGFEQGYPSKGVVDAYLKAAGYDELMTDLTTVSGDSVKQYVKSTTGHDYSEMKYPLDWVYLKEYDLYCYEHGDTNQSQVSVISGVVNGDEYTVTYKNEAGDRYCVTFADNGDTYRFISNLPEKMMSGQSSGDIDQGMITVGMLIPDSDSRYLTEDDLKGFTSEELRIARNEIYARHGRKFNDSKLQEHFNSMDWYFPTTEAGDFDESILNDYEIKNLDLIAKYEKKVQ